MTLMTPPKPSAAAESAALSALVISDARRFEANPLSLATIRPAGHGQMGLSLMANGE